MNTGKTKHAQPILHFFCRPCAEYHLKTHPHYLAAKRRAAKRRKAKKPEGRKKGPVARE